MFIDRCIVEVRSGKGGDGCIAFRHEKYVPKGGPSGGNGGRGGSVIFVADSTINSLFNFTHSKVFKAEDGEDGDIKNQYGKAGKDLYVKVPVGTLVIDEDTKEIVFDFKEDKQQEIIAKGGRGGRGNLAFKNDRNKLPKVAENGLPGIKKRYILELKLIADVGIVGLPSVGKSTLLSIVSNAKPEIADYPFTTLSPNLGVVNHKYNSFVMADLPGLIKDASKGKGLGLDFLRHVERCRLIIHVVSMDKNSDPINDYKTIKNELKLYNKNLTKRPSIIVASKMDEDGAIEKYNEFKKLVKKPVIKLSALTNEGVEEILDKCIEILDKTPVIDLIEINKKEKVYNAKNDKSIFYIEHTKENEWRILGDSILRTYSLINLSTDEGVLKLLNYLKKIGVEEELVRLGVKEGDKVYLSDFVFEYIK